MTAQSVPSRHDHLIDFRPDVEGLRAVAVLSVVAYHLDASWLPGGFVGVDIFFVISGYLITALLLRRIAARRYSVVDFYAARIRRIFPALFVMLGASLAACFVLLPPAEMQEYGRTIRSTALFYSNIEFNRQTGYFDGAAELKPLLHTWSLAVEEQFYVIFPVLLALLARRFRAATPVVIAVCALLSLVLSTLWATKYPSLGFYSALSRAHELLIGAWVAAVSPSVMSQGLRRVLTFTGVGLLVIPLFAFSASTPFPGYFAALPCLGAALLIVTAAKSQTLAARVLSFAPVRFFGAISYSLYLWHWPILAFSRHWLQRDPGPLEKALLLALMLVVATLSWRFVELPARSMTMRSRRILWLGALVMLVAVVAGMVISATNGLEGRFDKVSQDYFKSASDFNPRRKDCHASDARPVTYDAKCVFGDRARLSKPAIAVWADSHGAELAPALGDAMALEHEAVAQITYSSCPPSQQFTPLKVSGCAQHNALTLRALSSDPDIQTVVMAAKYDVYTRQDATAFLEGIERSIVGLRMAGKRVVLVAQVPSYSYPVPQALGMRAFWKFEPIAFGQSRAVHEQLHGELLAALEGIRIRQNITIFNPADTLCVTGQCVTGELGKVFYFDSNHLSLTGAARVSEDMKPMLRLVGKRGTADE